MNEETKKQQFAVIPLGLLEDILAFLGTKPHVEVEPYIGAIRKNTRLLTEPKIEEESTPNNTSST